MANTIKFGNGQWATKEDSILAYNDENANFKPLPFVTSRATTATRVNKAGLLETVASGVPRVDYLDNSKGSYLLEPTSRNLISQSEAFGNSYWTKSGATIEGDASTAGSELVNSWLNKDFTSFTSSGSDITQMVSSGSGNNCYSVSAMTIGKMYKLEFTSSQGINAQIRISPNTSLTSGSVVFTNPISGLNTLYFTPTADYSYIGFYATSSFTDTQISGFTLKEVSGFSAPSVDSPLGAFKLVFDGSSRNFYTSFASTSGTSSSVYVKGTYGETIQFGVAGGDSLFTLSGEWQRLESYLATSATIFTLNTYGGATARELYIFGAQVEEQSYATSYIPTKGSQISRLSETASQTVPDGVIGQTEGTLFVDFNLKSINSSTTNEIYIRTYSGGNYIEIGSYGASLYARIYNGSLLANINSQNALVNGTRYKMAIGYAFNDAIFYVNGILQGVDTSTTIPTTNSILLQDQVNPKSVKQAKIYNTRLSNSELATLTTI